MCCEELSAERKHTNEIRSMLPECGTLFLRLNLVREAFEYYPTFLH
jgi:hypothetical protein